MEILLIEDNLSIVKGLEYLFKQENYNLNIATNLKEATQIIMERKISLIILDITLPDGNGLKFYENIVRKNNIPTIFLTAQDDEETIVEALNMGADDYITKPFSPLELVARVKTQLRRYTRYNTADPREQERNEHDFRGLFICQDSHQCTLNGEDLTLTPIEFNILWYLCEHRGKVVSSEELFEAVWKEKYMDGNNTVMAHIARLREKMKEPSRKPKFIKTVWGVGYTIE